MSKVLITGGLGFMAYHLATRLLAEGCRIDVVDNCQRGVRDAAIEALIDTGRYRFHRRDLMQDGALDDFDDDYELVFHFAAIVGVRNVVKQPYRVLWDNVVALGRMLDWSRRQKHLRRFVFPSTSEVYAGTLESYGMPIPTPEETPLVCGPLARPRTSYMLSKIVGEAMCLHSDLPVTVLRPHNVYGPRMGMAHVIPELLDRAHRAADGDTLLVFSPGHSRTFCYVDDAVALIVGLASSSRGLGGIYNVGTPHEETSIAELAEIIVGTVGKRLAIERGPVTEGSPARRRPDVSSVLAATGYTTFVPLPEGVRRTYGWYRENLFDNGAEEAAALSQVTSAH